MTVISGTNGPAIAGPPQTVCFDSPVQLGANVPPSGQTGTWSQVAGPATVNFSDVNDPNATATGLALPSTAYTLQWSIDGTPSCGPPSTDQVIITTNATQGPSVSNAGADQCLSAGTTAVTLAGNAPLAGETGTWTVVPAVGLAFTDPNLFNTTATITADDSYIVTWTLDTVAPGCQSTSDDAEITIGGTAVANAGIDQNVCSTTVTMAATSSTGDGLWTLVSGPGSFSIDDDTSPVAIFTFIYSGVYVFDWTVSNGSCSNNSDQVTIQVGIPPTTATVGVAQTICNNTTTTLSGNAFNQLTENGVWSVLSGAPNTPTFNNISDPNAIVSGLVTGSYTFRWTITGSTFCPSSSADVVVDVFAPANAGADQQLCEATNILLEATQGSTGTWTLVAGVGAVITQTPANSNAANVTITPGNTYTFNFMTDYAGCPNMSDDVIVVNSAGPSAQPDAGPDQLLCQADLIPVDTTTLAGNTPPVDGTVATWGFASEPSGSMANIDSPNSPTSTLSGLSVPGIYILEWNFALGNCGTNADVVRIEIFAPPSMAFAGPDQPTACSLNATLGADLPTVGIGTWSITSQPGGAAAIIDNPNSPTSTLSNIMFLGTYTLTWTVTNGPFIAGGCAPSVDSVDITFTDVPPSPADAGPDQEFCDVNSTNMAAVPVSPGTGTWSQTAGPGVTGPGSPAGIASPNNPNSLILGLVTGMYEFTWTSSNGGCDYSDAMLVTIVSAPSTANAGRSNTTTIFECYIGCDSYCYRNRYMDPGIRTYNSNVYRRK